jgi:Protein of unknown function (DUF3572)
MKSGSFPLGRTRRGAAQGRMTREAAEALAVAALGFLAADEEQLERFLALTGLNPNNLRHIAADPGFLAAVLDHLAGNETLLLAFCQEHGHDPLTVMQARQSLGGDSPWDST